MRRTLILSAVVLLITSTVVTTLEGTPGQMPGLALGSVVLLHAERVLALVVVTVAVLTVVVRAGSGHLPVELSTSGLRYEAEAADDTARAVADLQSQLDELANVVLVIAERLDAIADHL
jgi:hypothetical protein